MTLWRASTELRLTVAGKAERLAASVAKSVRLEAMSSRVERGLSYRGLWDTSG